MLLKNECTLGSQIAIIKRDSPDIYKTFFNRIYADDQKFYDWRLPLYYNACTYKFFLERAHRRRREQRINPRLPNLIDKIHASNALENTELPANFCLDAQLASKMAEYNNPIFFVESEMLDACMRTKPLREITVEELKLPFEGMSFILPHGKFFKSNKGRTGEVSFISISRNIPGTENINIPGAQVEIETQDHALIVSTMFIDTLESVTLRITNDGLCNIWETDFDMSWTEITGNEDGKQYFNSEFTADEDDFVKNMVAVCINLVMAMEACPELLVTERKVKHIRRDRSYEIWTPNTVGLKYRHKVIDGSVEKGSHASPRSHWRQGHWRRQGIGKINTRCICGDVANLHHPEEGFCQQLNCDCRQFNLSGRKFLTYDTKWIKPIFISKK